MEHNCNCKQALEMMLFGNLDSNYTLEQRVELFMKDNNFISQDENGNLIPLFKQVMDKLEENAK